jgi:hypothetical protein
MRNIVDLKIDKLLDKGLNDILKVLLLEEKDPTDFSFAFLSFAGNIPAESLSN